MKLNLNVQIGIAVAIIVIIFVLGIIGVAVWYFTKKEKFGEESDAEKLKGLACSSQVNRQLLIPYAILKYPQMLYPPNPMPSVKNCACML